MDVFDVGAGKQGRKLKVGISGLVGVVDVAVVSANFPSVISMATSGSSNSAAECGACAAKNPEGVRCGVILAGIDVNYQLRLGAVPPPPQRQTTAANKVNFRFMRIYYC